MVSSACWVDISLESLDPGLRSRLFHVSGRQWNDHGDRSGGRLRMRLYQFVQCIRHRHYDLNQRRQRYGWLPCQPNGFQTASNSPGNPQFFASKINPNGSGQLSMIYSTYFGGSNPAQAVAIGGGIAVDQTGSTPNMYITGTTNMLPQGLNGAPGFPLYAAQQACLNSASQTSCNRNSGGTNTDAFVAKFIRQSQPAPDLLHLPRRQRERYWQCDRGGFLQRRLYHRFNQFV